MRPPRSRRRTTRSPASRPPSRGTSTTDRAVSFRLVGGKGGVGKTTCAAAMGCAAARDGARTLVVSTDPASSLGDAFGLRLTSTPKRLPAPGAPLHGVEIDAARALDAWLAARRERLERIAVRGTWLDRDDVARLLRLSLPGIDEIAALFELTRFGRSRRFDLIVVDTAPTGHTLRLLAMPETLRRVARVFDHLQEKHRLLATALTGRWRPDEEDALVEEMDRDGRDLAALLRDRERLRMSWVTLAEPMAVEETLDALGHLDADGIPVAEVIVNRLTPPPRTPCRRCTAQRALEAGAVERLAVAAPRVRITGVLERDREPVGVPALTRIGKELSGSLNMPRATKRRVAAWTAAVRSAVRDSIEIAGPGTRLVLFGGKGGVGKTTCAAAVALDAAARARQRRVLLLSTDPAHSLADALGTPLSDRARPIRGAPRNLDVRELDATAGYRALRERYAAAIDAVFQRLGRGTPIDARHDRIVLHDLLDLAPPGVDELVAVSGVIDALEGSYGLVVMDTAPTGHALRLLETPALVHDWAKALMSIVLKYQAVIGAGGGLGELLLELSRGVGRLRALLGDASRTQFVAVTRAAALPREETRRLFAALERLRIAVPVVVVNAAGRGTCTLCRRAASAEAREVAALGREVRDRNAALLLAPAAVPPPHGPAELKAWRGRWRPVPTRGRAAR